jgi:preprotein translocase subunit YajC
MDWNLSQIILAMAPPTTQNGQQAQGWTMFVPLILFVVVFYFVVMRPQQKKAKAHAEMLKSVRRGDKIITTGGIVATVTNVTDKHVAVRSADAKLEITRAAIAEITERGTEKSES